MTTIKLMTNSHLMEQFTEDLLDDDRGPKFVFDNSKYSKALLDKGKGVINDIGSYLTLIRNYLNQIHSDDKSRVQHGWILLLCAIKDREKIDTKEILAGNFDLWIKWAMDYES